DRMHPSEHLAHEDAILGRRKLGPASPPPLEQREAIAFVLVQRLPVDHERRDDRYVVLAKLEREPMLLEDRVVGPAARSIELRDDEPVADADLVDAILVAREREHAAVALEAQAPHGLEDELGAQTRVRQLSIHRASSRR